MKRTITGLQTILILATLNISLTAQSTSFLEQNTIQIPDSCKPVIPKDTIFYPELNIDPGVIVEYEEMPVFPGGDRAVTDFIIKNTIYPTIAIRDSVSGRVVVRFVVGTGGCPTDFSILRGIRWDLDNEAIRVVKLLPKFKPGKMIKKSPEGWYWTTVNVWYMIPFNFSLINNPGIPEIVILPPNKQLIGN
jgi:TonB family protein